jgi:hypothetical protein
MRGSASLPLSLAHHHHSSSIHQHQVDTIPPHPHVSHTPIPCKYTHTRGDRHILSEVACDEDESTLTTPLLSRLPHHRSSITTTQPHMSLLHHVVTSSTNQRCSGRFVQKPARTRPTCTTTTRQLMPDIDLPIDSPSNRESNTHSQHR